MNSMKTGQPTAPRKESWGSRKAPVYMKKAPEENLRVLLWQSPVGERSPAPTSLFLCLYDRGRRHKKAPESKGSLTLRYEILSLLWAMGTLYINTIPCPPWECKQNRKGRVCASSRYQRTAGNVQYPLGHGSSQLLQDPVIGDIAQAHGKSAAQAASLPPTSRRTGRFSTLP